MSISSQRQRHIEKKQAKMLILDIQNSKLHICYFTHYKTAEKTDLFFSIKHKILVLKAVRKQGNSRQNLPCTMCEAIVPPKINNQTNDL